MAINRAPGTWITGWSENGTDITIANAFGAGNAFPEMTAAEADATTGDIANVAYAILCKLYAHYAALDTADQPTKMALYKNSTTDEATGKVTVSFSARFTTSVAVGQQNVDGE